MTTQRLPHHSPRLSLWASLGIPLAIAALLLIFEPTRLDFAISDLFYLPDEGFVARHNVFFENWFHDRVKQAVILIGVLSIAGLLLSFVYRRWAAWRLPLGYLVLAMGLSTAVVPPLKTLTGVHCPWDLTRYGGGETYSPLLGERAPTLKPGRCWPGGHASSGFTFFALYFLLRDRRPRLAKVALVGAFALGTALSLARMMQGAHFLSHNIWTAVFDWLICLGCYALMLYQPAPKGSIATPLGDQAASSSP
ncbi:phosphatase PAP2 family protein [Pseudomonas kuykendallii]|uniref:Membrane-associated enzyme, PAP2 (Acid phosphatase) superfamily n=1 Tax=Pseudomonas kuykendallii TaxID=1007099 RepID=A0A1H2YWD5_9PSED|nr:phosphatase PAP2 family protein [Pseudomonas kuykendallii]MCQ4269483.1 phosphatase PAP2 family protein [Pseudomonas kuykendallii]SDX09502.1 Membrane-associated enzyme, PAP2 (acid phosphatase) superfamily [Pseudomonas kuykendallii]